MTRRQANMLILIGIAAMGVQAWLVGEVCRLRTEVAQAKRSAQAAEVSALDTEVRSEQRFR